MRTFLLTWNPKIKLAWENYKDDIDEFKKTGNLSIIWTIKSNQQITKDDRIYMMRLGKEPKGIMGSGVVTDPPFLAPHYVDNKLVYYVRIEFEKLVNPEVDPYLSLDELDQGKLSNYNWTPRFSGAEIKTEFTVELEDLWDDFLKINNL